MLVLIPLSYEKIEEKYMVQTYKVDNIRIVSNAGLQIIHSIYGLSIALLRLKVMTGR